MSRLTVYSGTEILAELDGVTISEAEEDSEHAGAVTASNSEGKVVAVMQLRSQDGDVYYGFRSGSAENMRWEVDAAPSAREETQ